MLILQELNGKVPFEEQEKWNKPRKKNDCEKARKRGEKDGKYADFSSL